MSVTAKRLAEKFINEAKQLPAEDRPRYLRSVAVGFARLANDPRNARAKPALTKIGLEFAGAASKQHTMTDFQYLLETTRDAVQQLEHNGFYPGAAMDVLAIRGDTGGGGRGGAPGGAPGSPFAGGSPRMSIAPASWNVETTLGRAAAVTHNPTAEQIQQGVAQQQTVAFWQGDKTEAQAMSVDINLVLPPRPTFVTGLLNPRDARAFAVLQYGSDGNLGNFATIDVGLGRRVNVLGNYISVNVGMDAPGPGMVPAVLTLGASIAAFAAPSQAPVIRTVYFDAIDIDAFSDLVPIPQRAVCMLPPLVGDATSGAPTPGGTLSINFFGYDAQEIAQWQFDYTLQTSGMAPQPLPPDAFAFRVQYTGGGPASQSNIRVPFQLSL